MLGGEGRGSFDFASTKSAAPQSPSKNGFIAADAFVRPSKLGYTSRRCSVSGEGNGDFPRIEQHDLPGDGAAADGLGCGSRKFDSQQDATGRGMASAVPRTGAKANGL